MKIAATASNNGGRWSFLFPQFSRKSISLRIATLPLPIKPRLQPCRVKNNVVASSDAKRANLSASRTQRVELPVYGGQPYNISQFLSHPSGIQAMLNTKALENFEFIDTNAYRCTLPKLTLFNFEAAPVLDLRVIPTKEDCIVELFSCRFKGSEVVERQNDHFSATMINHITWDTNISEPFLEVDVKLNLSLEYEKFSLDSRFSTLEEANFIKYPIKPLNLQFFIGYLISKFGARMLTSYANMIVIYTQPFVLLPTSAVEGPGNIMIQALVDRLVPLLLQQLVQDYKKWVRQQRQLIN